MQQPKAQGVSGRAYDPAAMDVAARAAAADLERLSMEHGDAVTLVAGWLEAHFKGAGYRRLCRALREYAPQERVFRR